MGMQIDPETGEEINDGELPGPGAVDTAPGPGAPPEQGDPGEIDMGMPDLSDPTVDEDHGLLAAIDQTPAPGEVKPGATTDTSVKKGDKSSRSFSGVTQAGRAASRGIFDATDREADAEGQRLKGQLAENQAKLDIGFADQAMSLEMQRKIDEEHHEELRDLHSQALEFNKMQTQLEQGAMVQAQAESQKYMTGFQQEMVGVRQMMMQTGNPLGGLDPSRKLALGAATFIQGMLAAKGTTINVTGQIDHWVEREMAHHQDSIKNRTNAAQSQLTLFGLARQNAQDDWEARQRLRGFVIDGMKARLMMEADRYGAVSAKADAMMKAGQLEVAQQQNSMLLQDKVEKQIFDYKQLANTKAVAQAQASIQRGHLGLEQTREARLKAHMDKEDALAARKAAAKGEAGAQFQPISDPSTPNLDALGKPVKVMGPDGHMITPKTGAYLWAPDDKADKVVRQHATEKAAELKAEYQEGQQAMDELIKLRKGAEKVMGLPEFVRERNPEYMQYKAEQTRLIAVVRKAATGLSFTAGENKTYLDQLPDDKIGGGDMDKMMFSFGETMRTKYNAKMNSLVGAGLRKLTPEEREQAGYATYDDLDAGGGARNRNNLSDAPADKPSYQTDVGTVAAGGGSRVRAGTTSPSDFFEEPAMVQPSKAWSRFVGKDTPQPEAATRVDQLALGVLSPSTYRRAHPDDQSLPDRDEVLAGQLLAGLKDIAGKNANAPEIHYANKLVGYIDGIHSLAEKDPKAAQKAYTELLFTLEE